MSKTETSKLLSLAILVPTAFNIQHWRFVIVRRPQGLAKVAGALLAQRAGRRAQSTVAVKQAYSQGDEQARRDEAMRSCGMAAQTIMLAAKGMGYDSCPIDLTHFDQVAQLIRLPHDHVVAMNFAVGKGVRAPLPRGGQLALAEVVIEDRF